MRAMVCAIAAWDSGRAGAAAATGEASGANGSAALTSPGAGSAAAGGSASAATGAARATARRSAGRARAAGAGPGPSGPARSPRSAPRAEPAPSRPGPAFAPRRRCRPACPPTRQSPPPPAPPRRSPTRAGASRTLPPGSLHSRRGPRGSRAARRCLARTALRRTIPAPARASPPAPALVRASPPVPALARANPRAGARLGRGWPSSRRLRVDDGRAVEVRRAPEGHRSRRIDRLGLGPQAERIVIGAAPCGIAQHLIGQADLRARGHRREQRHGAHERPRDLRVARARHEPQQFIMVRPRLDRAVHGYPRLPTLAPWKLHPFATQIQSAPPQKPDAWSATAASKFGQRKINAEQEQNDPKRLPQRAARGNIPNGGLSKRAVVNALCGTDRSKSRRELRNRAAQALRSSSVTYRRRTYGRFSWTIRSG